MRIFVTQTSLYSTYYSRSSPRNTHRQIFQHGAIHERVSQTSRGALHRQFYGLSSVIFLGFWRCCTENASAADSACPESAASCSRGQNNAPTSNGSATTLHC